MFYEYLCVYRIGCSSDILGEDDPIGWFELEEEWVFEVTILNRAHVVVCDWL